MSKQLTPADRAQLADLVELAGSAEAVLETIQELEIVTGRRPSLLEVVNAIMERRLESAASLV